MAQVSESWLMSRIGWIGGGVKTTEQSPDVKLRAEKQKTRLRGLQINGNKNYKIWEAPQQPREF